MSQQQFFAEVDSERLARVHRALADMICHCCDPRSIRDVACECGIPQESVDDLWLTIIGGTQDNQEAA